MLVFCQVSENEVTEFLENAAEFTREKLQMADFMESSESKDIIYLSRTWFTGYCMLF